MNKHGENMRFEARDLKSYAEPVSKSDLREGEVYFAVQFADEKLLIPYVEPFVFLGKNLENGDSDLFYFQNFESYTAGVGYATATEEDRSMFHVYGPNDGQHLFEYERALDRLLVCSLRRQAAR